MCLEFRRVLFRTDRKSTRLNSSHTIISYAVFCWKNKDLAALRLHRERLLAHALLDDGRRLLRVRRPARAEIEHPRSLGLHLFFFNDAATTEIYTLSLHDALPI